MKDMYSFHDDQADFDRFYAIAKKTYLRIYERLGLIAKATEASGGAFTKKISYEFMVLTDAGEDDILYCDTCDFCVNVEVAKEKEGDDCTRCGKGKLAKARASEVGNVFDLGKKFAEDFEVSFANVKGEKQYPVMGCYGIGISRLMGVIVEKFNDEKGIIWPESVAPFKVHLLALAGTDGTAVYDDLQRAGIEVLFDDRDMSAGEKFAEADLLGIPWRAVVSPKVGEGKIELKKRNEKESRVVDVDDIKKFLNQPSQVH
jgi:prolyl-tRNA synthetase